MAHTGLSGGVSTVPTQIHVETLQAAWKHARRIPCLPSCGIGGISFTEKVFLKLTLTGTAECDPQWVGTVFLY